MRNIKEETPKTSDHQDNKFQKLIIFCERTSKRRLQVLIAYCEVTAIMFQ